MQTREKYRSVHIFQKSEELLFDIYALSPNVEQVLADNMKNCSIRLLDDLSEAYQKESLSQICHSLAKAKGKTIRLRSQLILCNDLGFITQENLNILYAKAAELTTIIKRMIEYLQNMIRSKKQNITKSPV